MTNLIIVHLATVIVCEKALNNMYCFVMFLRMGGGALNANRSSGMPVDAHPVLPLE